MSGPKDMTKPRPKPQFLRDIEHDGSISERAREIAKAENRTLSGPLGNKPEEPVAGFGHTWIR